MTQESVELYTRKEMEIRAAEKLSSMVSHLKFSNEKEALTYLRDALNELAVEHSNLFYSDYTPENNRVYFSVASPVKQLFVIDTHDSLNNPESTISVWIRTKEFIYKVVLDPEKSAYVFSSTDGSNSKSLNGLVINNDLKLNLINAITKDFF